MLAGGLDLLYRQALAAPHEPYLRLEVWRSGVKLTDDLTWEAGAVNATLASRVARTMTVTFDESMYPVNDDDLLAPFGNELRAFRGIKFADGHSYAWPIFRGRITTATLTEDSTVRIDARDRADDVAANRFRTPRNSNAGALVFDEWRRLVDEALPDATFGESDTFAQVIPILTAESERAGALDEMATALGAFWYPLANGDFVLRSYPWTVRRAPVITLADGPGGVITRSAATRARDGVFNSVTVTGERTDGTPPSAATAEDEDPSSPTWIDGPFGVRRILRQLNTPTSNERALQAARDLLRRTKARTESWAFSMAPDASLELGDPVALNVRGRTGIVQVLEAFTMPFDVKSSMPVRCRAQVFSTLDEEV